MRHQILYVIYSLLFSSYMLQAMDRKKAKLPWPPPVKNWVDFNERYFSLPTDIQKKIMSHYKALPENTVIIKPKKCCGFYSKQKSDLKKPQSIIMSGVVCDGKESPMLWNIVKRSDSNATCVYYRDDERSSYAKIYVSSFFTSLDKSRLFGPNKNMSFIIDNFFLMHRGAKEVGLQQTFGSNKIICLHPKQDMFVGYKNDDVYVGTIKNDICALDAFPLKNKNYGHQDSSYEKITFGPSTTLLMLQTFKNNSANLYKRLLHYNYSNHQVAVIDGSYEVAPNNKKFFLSKADLSYFDIDGDIIKDYNIFFDDFVFAPDQASYLLLRCGIGYVDHENKIKISKIRCYALYNFDTKGYLFFGQCLPKKQQERKNKLTNNTRQDQQQNNDNRLLTWDSLKQNYQGLSIQHIVEKRTRNTFSLLFYQDYKNEYGIMLTAAAQQWLEQKNPDQQKGQKILDWLKDKTIIANKYSLIWYAGNIFKNVYKKVQELKEKKEVNAKKGLTG